MKIKSLILTIIILLTTHCSNTLKNTANIYPGKPYLPNLDKTNHFTQIYLNSSPTNRKLATQYLAHNLTEDSPYNTMLRAKIQKSAAKSCKLLKSIDSAILAPNWQAHLINNIVNCELKQGHTIAAITTASNSYDSINSLHNKDFLIKIWNLVYQISLNQLKHLLHNSYSDNINIQGWLELAAIAKSQNTDKEALVNNWQENYPNHPAKLLIGSKTNLQPNKIAVLLPLHNNLAPISKAITQGIFAAYYQAKANQLITPKTITTFDTSQQDIADIYNTIKEKNYDLIIGPLTQAKVAELSKVNQHITTIALNSVVAANPNIFELDMRAEDEAIQMANYAYKHGARNIILYTTLEPKSQRITKAFSDQWRLLSGTIVTTISSSNLDDLTQEISNQLNIDNSKLRAKKLKSLLKMQFKFNPRRRADIDAIILATNAIGAKKITPLLHYFYSGNLPIYATSNIYTNNTQQNTNQDLNSIRFCDTNWIIPSNKPTWNKLSNILSNLWPHKITTKTRFFAIGIDAYLLSFNLSNLTLLPYAYINGATGKLYIDSNQHIKRHLNWAIIQQGVARKLLK